MCDINLWATGNFTPVPSKLIHSVLHNGNGPLTIHFDDNARNNILWKALRFYQMGGYYKDHTKDILLMTQFLWKQLELEVLNFQLIRQAIW